MIDNRIVKWRRGVARVGGHVLRWEASIGRWRCRLCGMTRDAVAHYVGDSCRGRRPAEPS